VSRTRPPSRWARGRNRDPRQVLGAEAEGIGDGGAIWVSARGTELGAVLGVATLGLVAWCAFALLGASAATPLVLLLFPALVASVQLGAWLGTRLHARRWRRAVDAVPSLQMIAAVTADRLRIWQVRDWWLRPRVRRIVDIPRAGVTVRRVRWYGSCDLVLDDDAELGLLFDPVATTASADAWRGKAWVAAFPPTAKRAPVAEGGAGRQ
jgi:hypothetical protein